MVMDEIYYRMLKWFSNNEPGKMNRFIQSISPNQYECKKWLVDSLDRIVIPRDTNQQFKVEIIGGWFGFPLIELLVERYGDQIKSIDFFEPDPFCCKVLSIYLKMWDKDLQEIRILNKDYFDHKIQRRTHLVINTSCEHMPDMASMKEYYVDPERTMLVLQSNDKIDEIDHTNCVENIHHFFKQAGIRELYGDTKVLKSKDRNIEHGEILTWWNRFMIMGKWDG